MRSDYAYFRSDGFRQEEQNSNTILLSSKLDRSIMDLEVLDVLEVRLFKLDTFKLSTSEFGTLVLRIFDP